MTTQAEVNILTLIMWLSFIAFVVYVFVYKMFIKGDF